MTLSRFVGRPLRLPDTAPCLPTGAVALHPGELVSGADPLPRDPTSPAARRSRILHWAELVAGGLLTLLAFYLHGVFQAHAGGLWRDEVNTVNLANLPTFAQIWDNLRFDSFPILIFPIVRGWTALFSGDDASLRALGMIMGVAILGALWLNARLFGHRLPLLAVALLGCNPLFIRYGDSLRGYGLGILLMLLTFGAVWRVVQALRPGRVAIAVILAVLSVQTLYYNSVLLLSTCVAGAITATWERDWKKAACVLGIGAPAALSLVPYADTILRVNQWNFLVRFGITFGWIWKKLSDVIGSPDPLGVWLWTLLFLGALALLSRLPWRPPAASAGAASQSARLTLFAGGTLVIGTVSYALFLHRLQYFTQPWYYITYLALAATALDAVYGAAMANQAPHAESWRVGRLAFVWIFLSLMLVQARAILFTRQTNLDLVGRTLTAQTSPDDLVVGLRWECAITFDHYYHGAAAAVTVPPIADHRLHRYDLVLQEMLRPDAIRPVLQKVERTLRSGHRVWLIGDPILPPSGGLASCDPAAGENGERRGTPDYYAFWTMQVSELLLHHADSVAKLDLRSPTPVLDFEDEPTGVFAGWH